MGILYNIDFDGVNMAGIYEMTVAEKMERLELLWKWVMTLKSGRYAHVKDQLRSDEGYDCFGVACDIFKEDTDRWVKKGENYYFMKEGEEIGLVFGPPKDLMNKLGLSGKDEEFLIKANDASDDFEMVIKYIIHYYIKPLEMSVKVFNMQREMI